MRTKRRTVFDIISVILFVMISLIMLIPIYKVLVDSFDLKTAYGMRLLPQQFGLDGYISVFTNPTLFQPFLISCVTTIAGTFAGLAISTLGAYVLIQWKMPGRKLLANFLLFTMIFNGGMIPTYLVMKALGLTNTLWVVILLPAINVYNLVLMRNFFEGIPASLFESAEIDGCSPMGTFFKIVLPIMKPTYLSVGILETMWVWNDYLLPYLTLDSTKYKTIPILIQYFRGGYGHVELGPMMACIMMVVIPIVIMYIFCQKYIIDGVVAGAVKG